MKTLADCDLSLKCLFDFDEFLNLVSLTQFRLIITFIEFRFIAFRLPNYVIFILKF